MTLKEILNKIKKEIKTNEIILRPVIYQQENSISIINETIEYNKTITINKNGLHIRNLTNTGEEEKFYKISETDKDVFAMLVRFYRSQSLGSNGYVYDFLRNIDIIIQMNKDGFLNEMLFSTEFFDMEYKTLKLKLYNAILRLLEKYIISHKLKKIKRIELKLKKEISYYYQDENNFILDVNFYVEKDETEELKKATTINLDLIKGNGIVDFKTRKRFASINTPAVGKDRGKYCIKEYNSGFVFLENDFLEFGLTMNDFLLKELSSFYVEDLVEELSDLSAETKNIIKNKINSWKNRYLPNSLNEEIEEKEGK